LLANCILASGLAHAQNTEYALEVMRELSDSSYHGRGYYEQGDLKAARYIASEFQKIGIKSWDNSYFQNYSFPVNTFQGDMELSLDGKKLKPGYDFVLRSFSNGAKGEFRLYHVDTLNFDEEKTISELAELDSLKDAIICDFMFARKNKALYKAIYASPAQTCIFIWDIELRFYKAYSGKQFNKCIIWADDDNLPQNPKSVKLDIDCHMMNDYLTQNVLGYIPGERKDAEWLVFTAHYDHIGMLGKDLHYPGANDNASGVAMLLNIAEHYSKNSSKYNLAFIAVSGEESGLLGSKYYTENPVFPLEDIKLVLNMDMVADNGDSLYVQFNDEAGPHIKKMESISEKNDLFKAFVREDVSGHSDHFPFTEKNVPAVFFILRGDMNQYYHTPLDDMEHIDTDGFNRLYKIIEFFIDA
jgi:hypothetical protein